VQQLLPLRPRPLSSSCVVEAWPRYQPAHSSRHQTHPMARRPAQENVVSGRDFKDLLNAKLNENVGGASKVQHDHHPSLAGAKGKEKDKDKEKKEEKRREKERKEREKKEKERDRDKEKEKEDKDKRDKKPKGGPIFGGQLKDGLYDKKGIKHAVAPFFDQALAYIEERGATHIATLKDGLGLARDNSHLCCSLVQWFPIQLQIPLDSSKKKHPRKKLKILLNELKPRTMPSGARSRILTPSRVIQPSILPCIVHITLYAPHLTIVFLPLFAKQILS